MSYFIASNRDPYLTSIEASSGRIVGKRVGWAITLG